MCLFIPMIFKFYLCLFISIFFDHKIRTMAQLALWQGDAARSLALAHEARTRAESTQALDLQGLAWWAAGQAAIEVEESQSLACGGVVEDTCCEEKLWERSLLSAWSRRSP